MARDRHGEFVTLAFRGDGMVISPTPEGRAEAQEMLDSERKSSDYELQEMIRDFLGNGWSFVDPSDIGALTDAPIISEDSSFNDDGSVMFHHGAKVYAHMNYMVEDPIKTWAEGRSVYFVGATVERKVA